MSLDDDLRTLAEMQYAVLSCAQSQALGLTPAGKRHRLAGPEWELATSGVLRLLGAPRTIRQRLMVAVLDVGPGTVISHWSAAAVWRLPGFSFGHVEVSRHWDLARRRGAVAKVHRPRLLPPNHLTERHGIPVTTLARTLFDVAAQVHPDRLERVVETVVSKSPSVLTSLRALLDDLGSHGRGGIAVMRSVLETRPEGYVATASGLEARFARLLAEAGEAPLDRQVDLGGHEWVGRVDFVDRELRIVFEVDSDLHHTSRLDREHDRRRDAALLGAGWLAVVRVSENEIWRRPAEALARVRRARSWASSVLVTESSTLGRDSATRTFGRRSDRAG